MKGLGIALIILGGAGLVYALKMDTTVYVPGETVRYGEFSASTPSQTVNNMGLMDDRRNAIIISGLAILVGCIFVGMATIADQVQPGEPAEHLIPAKKLRSAPETEEDYEATVGEKLLIGGIGLALVLLASWIVTRG